MHLELSIVRMSIQNSFRKPETLMSSLHCFSRKILSLERIMCNRRKMSIQLYTTRGSDKLSQFLASFWGLCAYSGWSNYTILLEVLKGRLGNGCGPDLEWRGGLPSSWMQQIAENAVSLPAVETQCWREGVAQAAWGHLAYSGGHTSLHVLAWTPSIC